MNVFLKSCKLIVRINKYCCVRCLFTNVRLCRTNPDSFSDAKWMNMNFDKTVYTGFENTKTLHLYRAALVLRLCSNDYVVKNALNLMNMLRRTLGKRIFTQVMQMTFYGHLCVGSEIEKAIQTMKEKNIRAMILVTIEGEAIESVNNFEGELMWFANNKNTILESLRICGKTESDGASRLIHFRLSALFPSTLLTKISTILIESRKSDAEKEKPAAVADLHNFQLLLEKKKFEKILSETDRKHLTEGLAHLDEVCREAQSNDLQFIIDSEYDCFNKAVRVITNYMMTQYNKEKPVVQQTYQAYFKKTLNEVKENLEFCRYQKICFGAKVVRGAYMDQERQRAKEQGIDDPIWENKNATDKSYNSIVSEVINEIANDDLRNSQFMIACHNEVSINLAIDFMRKLGINPNDGKVVFGQTYGLSDYISNWLGKNGYLVYKSTPIGAIEDTLPYLHRRAQENRAALDFRKDQQLILRELKKRWRLHTST